MIDHLRYADDSLLMTIARPVGSPPTPSAHRRSANPRKVSPIDANSLAIEAFHSKIVECKQLRACMKDLKNSRIQEIQDAAIARICPLSRNSKIPPPLKRGPHLLELPCRLITGEGKSPPLPHVADSSGSPEPGLFTTVYAKESQGFDRGDQSQEDGTLSLTHRQRSKCRAYRRVSTGPPRSLAVLVEPSASKEDLDSDEETEDSPYEPATSSSLPPLRKIKGWLQGGWKTSRRQTQ